MAEHDPTRHGQASDMNALTPGTPPLTATRTGTAPGAVLEPELQAHIGRQLRAVYEEIVNEPVPDRFVRLLEALAQEQPLAEKQAPDPGQTAECEQGERS